MTWSYPHVPGDMLAPAAARVRDGRRGAEGENRAGHPDFRAHLPGRIAWIEQRGPGRGRKLRERFARIDWGG